ncbi:MAG: hypothetical protein K0R12_1415 [Gammaproteobacteria bacterium]|jgi:hypothetical protein|nr:hypothetical protein [Gammaproteobacteria bacterium]
MGSLGFLYRGCHTVGEEREPNPFSLLSGTWESRIAPKSLGGCIVKCTERYAAKGCWKKRMPYSNRRDTGCNIT